MLRNIIKPLFTTVLSLVAFVAWSQTESDVTGTFVQNNEESILFFLIGLILIVCMGIILALSSLLMGTVKDIRKDVLIEKGLYDEADEADDPLVRVWSNLWHSLNGGVPIEQEEEIELNHEYDGIRELDNNLPPWWKAMFYGCIIWGVGYMAYYHVFNMGPLQIEEFEIEMVEAEAKMAALVKKQAESVDESNVVQLFDASDLTKGKVVFEQYCVVCHKDNGIGGTGPNLTDDYWLHGGAVSDIFKTIKYGVPGKPMIAWKMLTPVQTQQVASYIMSLDYVSADEGGKVPEGDLFLSEDETTETADSPSAEVPPEENVE